MTSQKAWALFNSWHRQQGTQRVDLLYKWTPSPLRTHMKFAQILRDSRKQHVGRLLRNHLWTVQKLPPCLNSPERVQSRIEHSLLFRVRERIMFQFPFFVPFRRRRHLDCEEDVGAWCNNGEVNRRSSLNAFSRTPRRQTSAPTLPLLETRASAAFMVAR